MRARSPITANIENYLKAIYQVERQRQVVRVKEISERLGVTYPSTSGILKKMEALGLVEHERYGYVRLSETGRAHAELICQRGERIARFLREVLGRPEELALSEACAIEHALSDEGADDFLRCLDLLSSPGELQDQLKAALQAPPHP